MRVRKKPPRLSDPGSIGSLKELKRVEVTWFDAASGGSWKEFGEIRRQDDEGLMECQTVGYLVKLGKKAITLCQTRAINGKLAGDWSIPRKWIKRVRVI